MPMRGRDRWRDAWLFVLILAFDLALYAPALKVPWIYDDYPHFTQNQRIQNPHGWRDIFKNGLQETRPVFNGSLALQARFSGRRAAPAHAANAALHAISAGLFFLLLRRLGSGWLGPFAAALVFAVHPIGVESVAYFNSRSGLLGVALVLAGLLLLARNSSVTTAGALLAFLLALGSKEDAAGGILAAAWMFGGGWKKRLLILSPLALVPLLYLVFDSPHWDSVGSSVATPWEYLWHQGVNLPLHLSQFLYPEPLTFDREIPPWVYSAPTLVAGWLVVAALGLLAWRFRDRAEGKALGWAILSLLPTHSIVAVRDVHATRILYPMLPGLCWLLTLPLSRAWAPVWKRSLIVAFALWVAALSLRTREELQLWKDPVALWQRDAETAPKQWRAWVNLGVELSERGYWDEAEDAFGKADRLRPNNPFVLYNRAALHVTRNDGKGSREEAIRLLREVLRLEPKKARARELLDRLTSPGR